AGPQPHARTFLAEVKHVWFLMQRTANAVPGIFSHRGIAIFLGVCLDCCANVAHVLAGTRLLDAKLQAAPGYLHQVLCLAVYLSNSKCHTRISDPAVVVNANVD